MELFHAAEPDGRRVDLTIERRGLVRVLPVAQPQDALVLQAEPGRPRIGCAVGGPEIHGDRRVILGGPPERLLGQPRAGGVAQPAVAT